MDSTSLLKYGLRIDCSVTRSIGRPKSRSRSSANPRPVGILAGRFAIREADQEVEITAMGVKTARCARPKQVEPLHTVAMTQFCQRHSLIFNNGDHDSRV